MDSYFKLTIGVISYNRPKELIRTINSLLPLPPFVEVLICDDKSPKISEILASLEGFLLNSQIRFFSNEVNLGYDRNLFQVIELACSDNVLLLGDDDYLEHESLVSVLQFIDSNKSFKCAFLNFKDINENRIYRSYPNLTYFDSKTLLKNGSFIFNSILFSGLLFSKSEIVSNKDVFVKYFHSIYIQVAIFVFLNSKFGSFFIKGPGVIVGGDGESGFGFNEASNGKDIDLKYRNNVTSNLNYHKRLFDVLRSISGDSKLYFFDAFIFEYKIRSIKAFFNARKLGRDFAESYWKALVKLNIYGLWKFVPVYLFIYLMPYKVLTFPFKISEFLILEIRKFKFK